MKLNWTKYKEVIADIESIQIQETIHRCVEHYLFHEINEHTEPTRRLVIEQLIELEILPQTADTYTGQVTRNIVEPFNFMGNDRS